MTIEFTHHLERDGGEIELAVTASIYDGELDDLSWKPAIDLSGDEEAELWKLAELELAALIQECRDEARAYREYDREMSRAEGF